MSTPTDPAPAGAASAGAGAAMPAAQESFQAGASPSLGAGAGQPARGTADGGAPGAVVGPGAPPAGQAGDGEPAAGTGADEQRAAKGPRSRAERAMARAQARRQEHGGGGARSAPAPAQDAGAAAPGDGSAGHARGQAGDGTRADGAAPVTASGDAAAGADPGTPGANGTATPPQDWPREWAERFGALPETARGLVLEMNRDMTTGLQRGLAEIAQLRKGHEALFAALDESRTQPGQVVELLGLAQRFEQQPREVLSTLAQQAGLEVFFDRAEAAGEVPEFQSAADLAKWAQEQALTTLRAEQQRASQDAATAAEQARVRDAVKAEFEAAAGRHADFRAHYPAVAEKLAANPALSVEDAYWLARVPALQKAAERVTELEREVAQHRAQAEHLRKARTQLPGGSNGHPAAPEAALRPAERALVRAQRRLAARARA